MTALVIYLSVTYTLAIVLSFVYTILADRLESRGWERASLLEYLIAIILAPITVPWWIVCFIRANRHL